MKFGRILGTGMAKIWSMDYRGPETRQQFILILLFLYTPSI